MSYQVIARRWRPRKFADVVGQDHVTRTIQNALKQGRLAHAFLFTGPRGVGKTSTARILARAVNCPNIDLQGDAEPCNECETCRALFEDREMDVIEMDAASYRGVDDVRRINDTSRLTPVAGRKKVYIIDEVHMFTREAFNAFLKTLEEPPEHVIFILATTDAHKVPSTILSRVQRFDFRPVQPADVVPHLKHICEAEGWPVEEEALWLIAQRGEGSLRDAEGLLDQIVSFSGGEVLLETTRDVLGVLPNELLAQTTRIIADHNLAAVPEFLEQLALRGMDYSELLRTLQLYWTDLVFLQEGLPVKGKSEPEIQRMTETAAGLGVGDLFRLIRLAETLEGSLKWSTAPRVRFEVAFLRWVSLDRVASIRDILDKFGSNADAPILREQPITSSAPSAPLVRTAPVLTSAPMPKESPAPPVVAKTLASEKVLSADDLSRQWPEIVAALRQRNPAAGAAASKWEIERFEGNVLTVRCTSTDSFTNEQMRRNLPLLTQTVTDVCSANVRVLAGTPVDKTPKEVPTLPPTTSATPANGNDLFSSVVSRFGGVEIDPEKTREPQ